MNAQLEQPVPFEIIEHSADGLTVRQASNGALRVTVMDADAKLFRRRAISGIAMRPAAELVLPHLNQLATDLLQQLDMPAEQVAGRLLALAGQIPLTKPKNTECVVAVLDGVHVITDGRDVFVSRKDLK